MCGRYYFDESIDLTQIRKVLESKYDQQTLQLWNVGEIYPSNVALVYTAANFELMKWEYQQYNRKLINTRIESIRDKDLYSQDYINHKCLVIASGFYEWDKNHIRHYLHQDTPFYLAGIFQLTNELSHFSIITTAASSTSSIHNRVPIVLNRQQAVDYLNNKLSLDQLIHLNPVFTDDKEIEMNSLF